METNRSLPVNIPYLYKVDFYIDGWFANSVEVRAWSRKEAWIESWLTDEYKSLKDVRHLMFDATRLEREDEI